MGLYYEQRPPDNDDASKPGCLDALVMTRVVLGLLFWPMAGIMGVVMGLGLALYLFTVHPALALIPVAIGIAVIYLLARWDQRRSTPEEFRE